MNDSEIFQQQRNIWELTVRMERAVISSKPVKLFKIRCDGVEGSTRLIAEFGAKGAQLVFDKIQPGNPMVYEPNGAFDGSVAAFRLLALDKETPSKVLLSVDWMPV